MLPRLVRVLLLAAAGRGGTADVAAEERGYECDAPGGRCGSLSSTDDEAAFLQSAAAPRRELLPPESGDEVLNTSGAGAGETGELLKLCHHTIVMATCSKFNEGDMTKFVNPAMIQETLAMNDTALADLWHAMGFTDHKKRVKCHDLCMGAVSYLESIGVAMPPSSDVACYKVNGQNVCGMDVHPKTLAEHARSGNDLRPDSGVVSVEGKEEEEEHEEKQAKKQQKRDEKKGEKQEAKEPLPHGLVQRSIVVTPGGLRSRWRSGGSGGPAVERPAALAGTSAARTAARRRQDGDSCPHTLEQACRLIVNFFRIFPPSNADVHISGPGTELAELSNERRADARQSSDVVIAEALTSAQAYVAAVLGALSDRSTGHYRKTWFGGSGSLTVAQVRDRIALTMNFVQRELGRVHFVYPADSAAKTSCGGTTVAFVWKWQNDKKGYHETEGPTCTSRDDPMTKQCAVDESGSFFVYLCRVWYESPESWRITTLVHEATHHTGPDDIEYDRERIQQLSQAQQIDNAANYQYFAETVATNRFGCSDSKNPQFNFKCSSGPCRCSSLANFCDDPGHGPAIREQCQGTCASCLGDDGQLVSSGSGSSPSSASSSSSSGGSAPAPAPAPKTKASKGGGWSSWWR